MLRAVAFQNHLIALRQIALQLLGSNFELLGQLYGIDTPFGINGQAHRVEAIDTEVALAFFFFAVHTGYLLYLYIGAQIEFFQKRQRAGSLLCGNKKALPCLIEISAYILYAALALQKLYKILFANAIIKHFLLVVLQYQLRGHCPRNAHLLYFLIERKRRTHGVFYYFFDFGSCKSGIDRIHQYRSLASLASGSPLHHQRVTGIGRKLGIKLPNQRAYLKLLEIHIYIFIKIERNTAAVVVGHRADALHLADARKHIF